MSQIKMLGKEVVTPIYNELTEEISKLEVKPKLVVISVGEDPASKRYMANKEKEALKCGFEFEHIALQSSVPEEYVKGYIRVLNKDNTVNGIIVQLPICSDEPMDVQSILNTINVEKDVDGLGDEQLLKLVSGDPTALIPCTPKGVMAMLDHYEIPLEGVPVSIVGRSRLVGLPLFHLMLRRNATPTLLHSKSWLATPLSSSEIIIGATGVPNLINKHNCLFNSSKTFINVGLSEVDGKFVGDISQEVLDQGGFVTPQAFGGTGVTTVCMLLKNTLQAYYQQLGQKQGGNN